MVIDVLSQVMLLVDFLAPTAATTAIAILILEVEQLGHVQDGSDDAVIDVLLVDDRCQHVLDQLA